MTYFILLKFLYQVDMKTVVKCPLEFLCYSPTSMTYSGGLIKSSSHENYLLLKILDQWNKFPILVLTFLYGSIFETLHFQKICPICRALTEVNASLINRFLDQIFWHTPIFCWLCSISVVMLNLILWLM